MKDNNTNNAVNNAANNFNPAGLKVRTGDPVLDAKLEGVLDPLQLGQLLLEARGLEVKLAGYGYNSLAITVYSPSGEELMGYTIGD